jgi:D-beta-D-heptose 7-phosphate kinase/D-beta-D-heptose 1-phosphate adenosyltransferase
VDFVVIFDEDTPAKLIKTLLPDILVKGGDYKAEEIVGYDTVTQNGGKVLCLDFLPGHSSSRIINKLKG